MSLREAVPAPLADTIAQTFASWRSRLQAYRTWRASYDRTLAELSAYSDRELVDLGICRADVEDIARKNADQAVGQR
jgi:uncharacterized protein YjiS (DUF1127 family)